MSVEKSNLLRYFIISRNTLVMPDAYDPISARTIEKAGFLAVQCSGYSMAAANCLPNEDALSLTLNLETTERICKSVDLPVMADGEDGYGSASAIEDTIKGFVNAGVAGINIEDQILQRPEQSASNNLPNTETVSVIDADDMVEKLKTARAAAETYGNPRLVLNARTDILRASQDRPEGLKKAIERSNLYLNAGADLSFVTGIETLKEAAAVIKGVDGPVSIAAGLPYNIAAFTIEELAQLGAARVSLPTVALLAAVKGTQKMLANLLGDGLLGKKNANHSRTSILCSPTELG